jgi:hypothetical protein
VRTIKICKAQNTAEKEVESSTLIFSDPLPDISSLRATRAAFNVEGERLADALVSVLPQGTLDVLLIKLLEHTRSLLVVRHPKNQA